MSSNDNLAHPPLDCAEIGRRLAEAGVGWALLCVEECDSSNREARDRFCAEPACAERGLAVFTSWQSAGRGRRGARWHSAPDRDLLFSVALRPAFPQSRWGRLTHAAALAVSKALEPDWPTEIKWPNDVYLDGRKIAGILLEAHPAEKLAVIGVGLNVNSDPESLDQTLAAPATSLRQAMPDQGLLVDRNQLAVRVLSAFYEAVDRVGDERFQSLISEIAQRSMLLERFVSLTLPNGEEIRGRVRGFGEEGELLVERRDGSLIPVLSADRVRLTDA